MRLGQIKEVEIGGRLRRCKLLKCDGCQTEFWRSLWHISEHNNFCTIKCYRKWECTEKKVECVSCRNKLIRKLNQFNKHKKFYCDQKCRTIFIKLYNPRQKRLRVRELGCLRRMFGIGIVPLELRKMAAFMQIQRNGFTKKTFNLIKKGKTYEAYI